MSDFDDLLDTPATDLKEELQIPPGTWTFTIKSITSKDYGCVLALTPVEAHANVDPDQAREYTDELDDDTVVFHSIRGKGRALQGALKTLCAAVGVDKPRDLIDEEVQALVSHQPRKNNPDEFWVVLSNIKAVGADEDED